MTTSKHLPNCFPPNCGPLGRPRRIAIAICLGMLALGNCVAEEGSGRQADVSGTLLPFIRDYWSHDSGVDVRSEVSFAYARLSGNKSPEVVVYMTGEGQCGSSGCNALILKPRGVSYRIVGRLSIARLPIRVLPSRTNGWHDLAVWVQGGGIQPGYFARLSFNGSRYPSNPSLAPKLSPRLANAGTTLPLHEEGERLYQ